MIQRVETIAKFIYYLIGDIYVAGIVLNSDNLKKFLLDGKKQFSVEEFIKKTYDNNTETKLSDILDLVKSDKKLEERLKIICLFLKVSCFEDYEFTKEDILMLNASVFNKDDNDSLKYLFGRMYAIFAGLKMDDNYVFDSIYGFIVRMNTVYENVIGDDFTELAYFIGKQQESSAFKLDMYSKNRMRAMEELEDLNNEINKNSIKDHDLLLNTIFEIHSKYSSSYFIDSKKCNLPIFYYKDTDNGNNYNYVLNNFEFDRFCNGNNEGRKGSNFFVALDNLINKSATYSSHDIEVLKDFIFLSLKKLDNNNYPTKHCLSIVFYKKEALEDLKKLCEIFPGDEKFIDEVIKNVNKRFEEYKNNKFILSIKNAFGNDDKKFMAFCRCKHGYYLNDLVQKFEKDNEFKSVDECTEVLLKDYILSYMSEYDINFQNMTSDNVLKAKINRSAIFIDNFDKNLIFNIRNNRVSNFEVFRKNAPDLIELEETLEKILNQETIGKERAKNVLKELKKPKKSESHDFYYIKAKVKSATKIEKPIFFNDLPKKYLNGEGYEKDNLIDAKIFNEKIKKDMRTFSIRIDKPEITFNISITKDYDLFKFWEIANEFNLFEAAVVANKDKKDILNDDLFSICGILDKNKLTINDSSKKLLSEVNTTIVNSIEKYLSLCSLNKLKECNNDLSKQGLNKNVNQI